MAPSLRQANQLIYVAIIPLVIPLLMATTLIEQPNGRSFGRIEPLPA